MDNFEEKINSFCKIKSEIDDYIWYVFDLYIEQEKINFNSPDVWDINKGDTYIQFSGSDGCMGCYDNKDLNIPLTFFINPEGELLKLKNKRLAEENKKKTAAKRATTIKEKKEFERLKKKFEGG